MTPKQLVKLYEKYGSLKGIARNTDLTYYGVRKVYVEAVDLGLIDQLSVGAKSREETKAPEPLVEGRIKVPQATMYVLPEKGKVKRYLLTCAQNNTKLHKTFWENLHAFAEYHDAEVLISRFSYFKSGLGARGDKAQFSTKEQLYGAKDVWWDEQLEPYLSDYRTQLAPGLIFCGNMNILPTAMRPLSGLESYTGRSSGIFPHVKSAMQSIPSMQGTPTKFNYTTGTVTMRNYIQRKAGLKADFHHCYGAILVEVDHNGTWFVRQINADSTGTFYDLDVEVKNGEVTHFHNVKAITWGDIHVAQLDPRVWGLGWANEDSMINELKPEYQFMHDVLDFHSRGHHDIKNPFAMFKKWWNGVENVKEEVKYVAKFLWDSRREFTKTIVVDSNHHHHIARWLNEQDARRDPQNVEFWLELQRDIYAHIKETNKEPNFLEQAILTSGCEVSSYVDDIKFLNQDDSFIICHDANGGVECGMHGDRGPNGARGNIYSFARMGRKANIGHSHTAGFHDGVAQSGTCGDLSPDYTAGPSSWSWTQIITYKNGKRGLITMYDGKWRA